MKERLSHNRVKKEDIQKTDVTQRPYVKPEIKEHDAIQEVTAGTGGRSSGSHYWHPC